MCRPSKASGAVPWMTQSIWSSFISAESRAVLAASQASSLGVSRARRMNLVMPAPTTATLRMPMVIAYSELKMTTAPLVVGTPRQDCARPTWARGNCRGPAWRRS